MMIPEEKGRSEEGTVVRRAHHWIGIYRASGHNFYNQQRRIHYNDSMVGVKNAVQIPPKTISFGPYLLAFCNFVVVRCGLGGNGISVIMQGKCSSSGLDLTHFWRKMATVSVQLYEVLLLSTLCTGSL